MNQTENFVYVFDGTPYINLTNRCCCDCVFCLRNSGDGVGEDSLWLSREPSAPEVIGILKTKYTQEKAVVFCGYGEPTYRVDELRQIAQFAKANGMHTRLNTNGLGNLIHGRNIVPDLAGVIDTVSVSLNASTATRYSKISRPVFGEQSFGALLDFAGGCVKAGIETVLSVVDINLSGGETEACRRIAQDLGAEFRVRKYIGG